uniref:cardiotrophin-2-like n=1 Tax=Euleptes europaea TaxID=460621 RepID=UPI002541F017|nr:cardiotrophin-2-like [Euleptes europaea]
MTKLKEKLVTKKEKGKCVMPGAVPARAAAHKEESLARTEELGRQCPASSIWERQKDFNTTERYPHPPLGGSSRKLLEARNLLVICALLLHVVSPDPDLSGAAAAINQTFNLVRHMQLNTTVLLHTYLIHQGSPFSNPGFDTQRIGYEGVPSADIPFLTWCNLSDCERLSHNYKAYTEFFEFLLLIRNDQLELNPNQGDLLEMLKVTQLHIRGLLSNLTSIMVALQFPVTRPQDTLPLQAAGANNFEKKVRGYVVCLRYKEWIDRTVKDFARLTTKFPLPSFSP